MLRGQTSSYESEAGQKMSVSENILTAAAGLINGCVGGRAEAEIPVITLSEYSESERFFDGGRLFSMKLALRRICGDDARQTYSQLCSEAEMIEKMPSAEGLLFFFVRSDKPVFTGFSEDGREIYRADIYIEAAQRGDLP